MILLFLAMWKRSVLLMDLLHTTAGTIDEEEVKPTLTIDTYTCTEDESVCTYTDICYNIHSQAWETNYDVLLKDPDMPLLNNMGLYQKQNKKNNKDLTEYFKNPEEKLEDSLHCQESLKPVKKATRPTSAMAVKGVTYFLCSF